MADKKISDFTTLTVVTSGDLFEVETSGGNSRKVDAKLLGVGFGTSFPGSPSTDDRFYRTDRRIEYFYDGTRWLSCQLFNGDIQTNEAALPFTATATLRMANPFWNVYSIYIEEFIVAMFNSATTSANYFTVQLITRDGGSNTNLGSGISGQNDTINNYVAHRETINTVVGSSVDALTALATETGTATVYVLASITYRLIG